MTGEYLHIGYIKTDYYIRASDGVPKLSVTKSPEIDIITALGLNTYTQHALHDSVTEETPEDTQ